jgi:hypothetical protein
MHMNLGYVETTVVPFCIDGFMWNSIEMNMSANSYLVLKAFCLARALCSALKHSSLKLRIMRQARARHKDNKAIAPHMEN